MWWWQIKCYEFSFWLLVEAVHLLKSTVSIVIMKVDFTSRESKNQNSQTGAHGEKNTDIESQHLEIL